MNIVSIKLSAIHENFLRKELKAPKGPIKLKRNHVIGRFIYATIETTHEKPEIEEGASVFLLPDSHQYEEEWFYFIVTTERKKWITDFIQAFFDIQVELFFVKGYRQGYRQKDIIYAFIQYYNLDNTLPMYEMIAKRDYRKRKNIKKIIAENIIKS